VSRTTTLRAASTFVATTLAAAPFGSAFAQQSDLAISPFVSFLPSAGASPLAGLALTIAGNSGFGVRGSAHLSLQDPNTNGQFNTLATYRPWGADADLVLSIGGRAFGGYNRTFAPFVFAGIGTSGSDSTGRTVMKSNWSYGAGVSIPLGGALDLFGESRWRMSQYVLPTAQLAPTPTTELRFGLSFHIPTGPSGSGMRRSRDRHADATRAITIPGSRVPASARASRVIGTAEDYIGVPYRYGGTSPSSGFDCSGFVQYVFAKQGVRLPRTARQQADVGTSLPADWRAVSPGDLVMFEEDGRISHVAIYAGHDRIIHSSASGGGVRYDDLTTHRGEWFVDHMVAARRVTPDPRGLMLDLARGFGAGVTLQLDGPDHAPSK
jgi:cell wall-associated NlpC family hydrolase